MKKQDLSVTALYTSATWSWGELPNASLLDHPHARGVFQIVNAVLALTAPLFGKLAPLRVGLLHRHAMIDALVRAAGTKRVLELAAGLSRRGVTFSVDPAVEYIEIDAAHVIATKKTLLERTASGQSVLGRPNLRFLAADVTTSSIEEMAPPDGAPLLVVAEGLLMYLDAGKQRALFRDVATRLGDAGGTFVFDLVPPCEQPAPGLVGRVLDWLMKRFTGGQSFIRDGRTRDDVAADLRAAGFEDVAMIEPPDVAIDWALPYPRARTQQLVFVARVAPLLALPPRSSPPPRTLAPVAAS